MSTQPPINSTHLIEEGTITQAHLRCYLKLKENVEKATRELSQLRRMILRSLEAGTPVEAGELTASIRAMLRRVLDGPRLIPILGKARVEELRGLVVPVPQKCLIVAEKQDE